MRTPKKPTISRCKSSSTFHQHLSRASIHRTKNNKLRRAMPRQQVPQPKTHWSALALRLGIIAALTVPSMLRSIARSYSSNVQIRAVSHTSGDDLHQSMPARPRPRHRYRHRSSGSTQKPLDAIKDNDVDDGDASSPDNYHRPIRIDTEASLGLRTSAAERLWNAVQADPKSILARIIMEDLTEVPAIYRIMVLYAVCIIVLQSLLACATHRIFGFAAFLIIAAVIASTEVRHMLDLFNRLGRVRRLGAILAEQRRRALLSEQRRSSVPSNGTK